jgi:hypothetical protein
MRGKFGRRRKWLLALLVAAVPAAFLTIPTGSANADPATVYMRDYPGDTGATPSNPPGGVFWSSPDIVVCPNPAPCASDVPVTPGTTYYLDITLRDPGATVTGQLSVLVTQSSGASTWASPPWTSFATVPDTLTTGVHTLVVPWTAPGSISPGQHFCLAAVWTSPTDLLTNFPDIGSQVRYNRNMVQHNVVMAGLVVGVHIPVLVDLRDPYPHPDTAGIMFVPLSQTSPFIGPGTVVIDLGASLTQRWIAGGAQGTGIKRVGQTQVQIVDPKQAQIYGLPLDPGDDFQLSMDVVAGSAAVGNQYTTELVQTDAQGNIDGGVEYRFAVSAQKG